MKIYTFECGKVIYDNPDNTPNENGYELECTNELSFTTEKKARKTMQTYLNNAATTGSNAYFELYSGEIELSSEELKELRETSCLADPPKDALLQVIMIKNYS